MSGIGAGASASVSASVSANAGAAAASSFAKALMDGASLPAAAVAAAEAPPPAPAPAPAPPSIGLRAPSAAVPAASSDNGTVDLSGMQVLLVDDEADARELLSEILRRAGARVASAASAREAMELLPQARTDVIVSDIAMPQEDGYRLIRRIRDLPHDQGGNIPAIALTAYARMEDRDRAIEAGFQAHISKPAEPAVLLSTIADLLRHPHDGSAGTNGDAAVGALRDG
jgi:CheY-like chemotaxis protein